MSAGACPSSQEALTWTCGVSQCCDTVSCDVNVAGRCICATYGDPSPSQPGWNYSFMATCAQNSVTGTPLGAECYTLLGVDYASSCYCRPVTADDVGQIGDQVPGNAIYDTNDNCVAFVAAGGGGSKDTGGSGATGTQTGTAVSPTASTRSGATAMMDASATVALLAVLLFWFSRSN